ncbi:MAG: acyltransferase [Vicinamibacteria bacterium]|nr:acyltransferase [Vicinamibacteria bacterium]
MSRTIRVALSETCNAYSDMPASLADLKALANRLDDIRAANVAHHVDLARAAAGAGAQVLGMGELFTGPYFALGRDPMWLGLAEDALVGPTVTTLRGTARETGLILVAPIFEHDPRSGRRFNTAVVIDEAGEILGRYRKTHIPVGTNEQASFCETFYYDRSDGDLGTWPRNVSSNPFFPVFETRLVRLGVAICYDRHFEGVMSALAENGAELVLSPAVTFGAKSRRMWDLEFPVDAARHNLYIGGSNRRGVEPPWTQEYFGASYFAGPDGVVPNVVAPTTNLVIADLDLDLLGGADPSGWDLPRDRRPDIYRPKV